MNHDRIQPEKRLSVELHEILRAWVRTLPIEGRSGESIVTLRDLASLSMQLEKAVGERASRVYLQAVNSGGQANI